MDKIKVFEQELTYIKNKEIKDSAVVLINLLPDYFFQVAASSTGKYHPDYALGDRGLIRHTKAAVRFANELLNDPIIGDKYTSVEQDLIILGLIIHDGLKHGFEQNQYTKFEHPLLITKLLDDNKNKLTLNEQQLNLLKSIVASHMGPWNKDYDGNEVLPVPKTKYERFVHMCDYLASRKCFTLKFDGNDNII